MLKQYSRSGSQSCWYCLCFLKGPQAIPSVCFAYCTLRWPAYPLLCMPSIWFAYCLAYCLATEGSSSSTFLPTCLNLLIVSQATPSRARSRNKFGWVGSGNSSNKLVKQKRTRRVNTNWYKLDLQGNKCHIYCCAYWWSEGKTVVPTSWPCSACKFKQVGRNVVLPSVAKQ